MSIDLDEIIKALAHPVRREILSWLKDPLACFPDQSHSNEHGVCAGQIDQRAGLSQSTVSAHLATLQRAGLISSRWEATENNRRAKYYALTEKGRRKLSSETQEWARQVEAIARVLEAS